MNGIAGAYRKYEFSTFRLPLLNYSYRKDTNNLDEHRFAFCIFLECETSGQEGYELQTQLGPAAVPNRSKEHILSLKT